jgi:hypothetical protein
MAGIVRLRTKAMEFVIRVNYVSVGVSKIDHSSREVYGMKYLLSFWP